MGLLLRDTRVLDTVTKTVRPADIRIEGGRIAAVEAGAAQQSDEVIDCDGRFAMPGLMDMHIHLRGSGEKGPRLETSVEQGSKALDEEAAVRHSRLHTFLYCGVTSLYDAGNDPDVMLPLREAERSGETIAPRIFCTGSLLTCPGGHAWQLGARQISSLPADLAVLQEFLLTDPDIVKITYDEHNWGVRPLIPILSTETLRQIIDFCHEHERRVTVHVSNELRAREAVQAGADSLAHPVIQSPVTKAFLWLLAQRQMPVVSTLAIGERYSRIGKHSEFLDEEPYLSCLGERERLHLKTVESDRQRDDRWAAWMEVMTPVAQENLRRLVEAGGVMVTGTDLSLGPDYLRELELLQDAGIEPWDVLRAATHNGGVFLGRSGELGDIAPGCAADVLLLDEDPTQDVSHVSRVWRLYKGGAEIDRQALDLPGVRTARG